jgi:hypothetical protein
MKIVSLAFVISATSSIIHHTTFFTNFLGAAIAILQAAVDLHPYSSNEVTQKKNAIRAIGNIVN